MIKQPFEIDDIKILTPYTFTPSAATTSTEDSDRTQDLVMHNTPMGTIESYNIGFEYIPVKEAAVIYQKIKNKSQYKLRYMSASLGEWTTGQFYTSNYSFGTLMVSNGEFVWKSLSFNAIGVYPV